MVIVMLFLLIKKGKLIDEETNELHEGKLKKKKKKKGDMHDKICLDFTF